MSKGRMRVHGLRSVVQQSPDYCCQQWKRLKHQAWIFNNVLLVVSVILACKLLVPRYIFKEIILTLQLIAQELARCVILHIFCFDNYRRWTTRSLQDVKISNKSYAGMQAMQAMVGNVFRRNPRPARVMPECRLCRLWWEMFLEEIRDQQT